MAKKKVISLRAIVREISKTASALERAEKTAAMEKKKGLSLKIKKLRKMESTLKLMCRNGFNVPTG
jgi:hypothetical protein